MADQIPQESVENLQAIEDDVALNTIHRSSDGSDHSKVTDNETAITLKADPVDISGTHTETVLTIDFSAIQGKIITLSADRAYAITGLSNSNPVGILTITHNGFIPTFSGITELESLLDKLGIYYLKFVRQADGTIIQINQNSGSVSLTIIQALSELELATANANPIVLKTGSGVGITDNITQIRAYLDYISASSGNVTLQILSGTDVVGEIAILDGTISKWYTIPVIGKFAENEELTAKIKDGEKTGGASNIGLYIVRDTLISDDLFLFPIYDIDTLGSTSDLEISTSTNSARRGQRLAPEANGFIDSITVRHDTVSGNGLVAVYSDSALSPDALLGVSVSEDASTVGQDWTTHVFSTPVPITKGTDIWIAFIFDNTTIQGYYSSSSDAVYGSSIYEMSDPFGNVIDYTHMYPAYANVRYLQGTYNYIVNDDFAYSWANPDRPDGYDLFGIPDANNYTEENINGARLVSDGVVNIGFVKTGVLIIGQEYFVEVEIHTKTTGYCILYGGTAANNLFYVKKNVMVFTATNEDLRFSRGPGGCDNIIKGIKVWQ